MLERIGCFDPECNNSWGVLGVVEEDFQGILVILNHQKDMILGLEEEVARRLAEGEEGLRRGGGKEKSAATSRCRVAEEKRDDRRGEKRGTKRMGGAPPDPFFFWKFYWTQDMEGGGDEDWFRDRGDDSGEEEGGERER